MSFKVNDKLEKQNATQIVSMPLYFKQKNIMWSYRGIDCLILFSQII